MTNEKKLNILDRLMEEVYRGVGLDGVVCLAAEILETPVYFADMSGRYIAVSSELNTSETYQSGYITDIERVSARKHLFPQLLLTVHPFLATKKDGTTNLVAPIRLRGEIVGAVCALHRNPGFIDGDLEAMGLIAKAITIELQKNRFYQDNRGTELGYQLLDAITLDRNKRPNVKISFSEWNHYAYTYMLSITAGHGINEQDRTFNILLRFLRDMLRGDIAAQSDNGVVLLVTQPHPFTADCTKYKQICEFLEIYDLRAGCSRRITSLDNCDKYYTESCVAKELGDTLDSEQRIIFYDDVMVYHMLQVMESVKPLGDLIHPGLEMLAEHDKQFHTNYCNTLYQYLVTNRKISDAAEKLSVHKNTLFYRLTKIEEIVGESLSDQSVIMKFMLAFHIWNYQKHKGEAK